MFKGDGTLADERMWNIHHTNSYYQFPRYKSREEWFSRAEYLRQHILVCCGLSPLPLKSPLNPKIFGRIKKNDYIVEKVYFESYPGFFVTGNLYTPLGRNPPFPGVLCPHGHWINGRFDRLKVVGRCINFAKQGCVAFSYDMVGFMDSFQIIHHFGSGERDALWGINLAGLQLWNSIRSIDFLQSLDIVNPELIGCTGASGGATQTFLLTAVDDRISVAAPVCMVSSSFQGGCSCENPPNLRVETFNTEIAALAAPRPLLLVSATGDWTTKTPVNEYPSIKRIYSLFNAEDKIKNVHIQAGHNYNKESRETVYSWFGRWLLGEEDETLLREMPSKKIPMKELGRSLPSSMIFYGRSLPKTEVNSETLRKYLISQAKETLRKVEPKDIEGLKEYREILGEVYKHSLLAHQPEKENVEVSVLSQSEVGKFQVSNLILSRKGLGDKIPALEVKNSSADQNRSTLIIHEKGKEALLDLERGDVKFIVNELVNLGQRILLIDCFATGKYLNVKGIMNRGKDVEFFTTYNRTDTAERIQDILTGITYLNKATSGKINIIGLKEAGLWCLLARGLAENVDSAVIDVNGFKQDDEREWLQRLFIPLLRRAGAFETAITLAAPSKLFIHNCKGRFKPDFATKLYEKLNASTQLKIKRKEATVTEIIQWVTP